MEKPMVRIHNTETNEIIDREMTNEEFEEYTIEQAKRQEEEDNKTAQELKKQEVLNKLGLTSDEMSAILS